MKEKLNNKKICNNNCYFGTVIHRCTGTPIQKVAVTDGKHIVFTNEKGEYSLPGWEKSNTISVSVLTQHHDDWYVYTGGKYGNYNFEVEPVSVEGDFEFLHVTDSEVENRDMNEWLDFIREHIKEKEPAFLIHTGDIAREEAMKRHYKEMNSHTMGCPVRYVIGNHDYTEGDYGEQLYEQLYGPVWCSFDVGNVHCIILPMGRGDKPAGYTKEEAQEWFRKDVELVAKGKPIVVFNHTHAQSGYELVENHVLAWVMGHYHYNFHYEKDGVAHISTTCPDTGGIDSSPASIRKVCIQKEQVSSKVLYYGSKKELLKEQSIWNCKLHGRVANAELVMVDGDIIVATMDDDYPKQCGIYRVDGENGRIKWSFETTNGIKNNFAVDERNVYALDCAGYLYAIDIHSGKLQKGKQIEESRPNYTCSNVLLVEDTLFLCSNANLFALDKNTFCEKWRHAMGRNVATTARLVFDEKRRAVIAGIQWYNLCSLNVDTGELNWESRERSIWFRNSTPVICDDYIYTGGWNIASCLDAITGAILKEQPVNSSLNVCGPPTIDEDWIYYPTAALGVVALDKNTMEVKQTYAADTTLLYTAPYVRGDAQMVEGSPVIIGEYLMFATLGGSVYIYKKETAELVERIRFGTPALVKPMISNDAFYVADFEGNLLKYEMK